MLSNKPYLLRAFHDWIVDSACTPILVIDANNPRCKIPKDYAEGGEIVFNISATAIRDLKLANDVIEFKASFSGVIHLISAPVSAILALYAEENGEGLFLDANEEEGASTGTGTPILLKSVSDDTIVPADMPPSPPKSKPFLKLVE